MFARVVLVLIGIALPFPGHAVDVDLSVIGSGQFDTNAARSEGVEEGETSFRIGPTVGVSDERPKFGYGVRYSPIYEKFVERDEFDKLSHFAGGSMNYRIGNKTALSLTENFTLTQLANQDSFGLEADDIDIAPRTETGRGDTYNNTASFVALHGFSQRFSGQFSLTHQFFDSADSNSSQNSTLSGLTSLTYVAGARDHVGLGGGMTWQQFGAVRGQPASDTYSYRIFASWSHNFGRNTQFSIQAGPALISNQQQRPDPEGLDEQFPHLDVDQEGTVAQVYDRLGLDEPSAVTNLLGVAGSPGSILASDFVIPAGSILVPDPATCPTPLMVSSAFGLTPATCQFSRIARPTGTNPNQVDFVNTVQAASIDFAFPPGTNPGSTDGSTITIFGNVSLSHQWTANLSSSLTYSRQDSSSSGLGSSTVADSVAFDTGWTPYSKLNLSLRFNWVQQKSTNEITNSFRNITVERVTIGGLPLPGSQFDAVAFTEDLGSITTDDSIATINYGVTGQATYQFSRRVTLFATLTFQKQDSEGTSTSSISNFGDVIAVLGVRYDLDRLHF